MLDVHSTQSSIQQHKMFCGVFRLDNGAFIICWFHWPKKSTTKQFVLMNAGKILCQMAVFIDVQVMAI